VGTVTGCCVGDEAPAGNADGEHELRRGSTDSDEVRCCADSPATSEGERTERRKRTWGREKEELGCGREKGETRRRLL
jgi:hypothetical protein